MLGRFSAFRRRPIVPTERRERIFLLDVPRSSDRETVDSPGTRRFASGFQYAWVPQLVARIITTFLELGDATSRNLEYCHQRSVAVSYGEETITETNLLEIRRRHPRRVRLETFAKWKEALTGADWQWRIVGSRYRLDMRVQAKRLQRNNALRVKHKVGSSRNQQRDLLIQQAQADGMKPVYCIYCTEPQRSHWKVGVDVNGFEGYETGCLLVDALDVPLTATNLPAIEKKCIPWHYLFNQVDYVRWSSEAILEESGDRVAFIASRSSIAPLAKYSHDLGRGPSDGWTPPTINDLNNEESPERKFDWSGVHETEAEDRLRLQPDSVEGRRLREFDRERLRARGIHRMLVIDARDEDDGDVPR